MDAILDAFGGAGGPRNERSSCVSRAWSHQDDRRIIHTCKHIYESVFGGPAIAVARLHGMARQLSVHISLAGSLLCFIKISPYRRHWLDVA